MPETHDVGKPVTIGEMCDVIADAIQRGRYVIRNKRTGKELHTAEEIYNYSDTGELFMIWEWYYACRAFKADD